MTTLWIVLGVILLLVLWVVGIYNKLVVLKNRVKDAWAQINVQLKRRFDLIPNLVETVKGYAAHESGTFEKVTEARTKFMSAQTPAQAIESSNQLTGALTHLFAVAEQYPELKANTNFLDLQGQLKETEDKLAYTRQFYNDTVLIYNNAIMVVPNNIVAGMFNFAAETFFEVADAEREAPKVQF